MDLSFYKGKKVFITGNTGFKGSWLSQILLNGGASVTGYALECPEPGLYSILELEKNMNSIKGDVRDLESLQKAVFSAKPDIVLHLAAQPIVRESYKNPVYTYETNVIGTVNILESARNCGSVRSFLNVTTDKVYLNNEWHWGYRENDRLCGFDPYSNSKSCSELVTYSYLNSFFNQDGSASVSAARSGNVIGGGDFASDRIIPDCVRAAAKKQDIIVRNPHSTRPYQHVLECLSGYLLLAQKQYEDKNKYEGCYNFGPDDESCVTTGELVTLFCERWGDGQAWVNKSDNGPHEASFLKLDCSKSKNVLGWKPHWNIDRAVGETVKWYRSYLSGDNIIKCTDEQIKDYFK